AGVPLLLCSAERFNSARCHLKLSCEGCEKVGERRGHAEVPTRAMDQPLKCRKRINIRREASVYSTKSDSHCSYQIRFLSPASYQIRFLSPAPPKHPPKLQHLSP